MRIEGAPPQSAVHKRRTDAVKWARSVDVAMREQRFFPSAAALGRTVAEAIDQYVELGSTLLADLSPDSVGQARDHLTRSPAVNKEAVGKGKARPRAPVILS